MPYIKSAAARRAFDHALIDLNYESIDGVGELNYIITRLISNYLGPQMDYERLNSIIGVLECAKQEFYRRVVAPYEDKKIEDNGDVYPSAIAPDPVS